MDISELLPVDVKINSEVEQILQSKYTN